VPAFTISEAMARAVSPDFWSATPWMAITATRSVRRAAPGSGRSSPAMLVVALTVVLLRADDRLR